MIGDQMCFSQSTQKLPLKLADKQVHWLLKHIVKQSFNLMSQGCKLHLKNKELVIMFHAESFSFFHVSFTLQVILIVFVKEAEQIWIGLKI